MVGVMAVKFRIQKAADSISGLRLISFAREGLLILAVRRFPLGARSDASHDARCPRLSGIS